MQVEGTRYSKQVIKELESSLRSALYWLTMIELGYAEPADAKLFLDSMPNDLLPTEEDIEKARTM